MKRGSGILLPITALPTRYGIGDFGPAAYLFIDFLKRHEQLYWQLLPLTITDSAYGNSPYSSISAFAGNELFISFDFLVRDGYLTSDAIAQVPSFPSPAVDYERVRSYKKTVLDKAYASFSRRKDRSAYETFCAEESAWLDTYAFFSSFKEKISSGPWYTWPAAVRDRDEAVIRDYRKKLTDVIEKKKFFQFLFYTQWRALKAYAQQNDVCMIGDLPIYVNNDSVDVWAHPSLFKLNKEKMPTVVAGVPPDYFSETGQRWGNPVYNWRILQDTGYAWWLSRLTHSFSLYDMVRIDHFRGFVAAWEIPVDKETAIDGSWVPAPVYDFFDRIVARFSNDRIIAEDLGVITDDVREVMDYYDFPGMKVLLFGFADDLPFHPYIPHNYTPRCVVYTGTHDNNTIRGWYDEEATDNNRIQLSRYLEKPIDKNSVHQEIIRLALYSVAAIAIIPLQDVLGLGSAARMNKPATGSGNWKWRIANDTVLKGIHEWLHQMTIITGRTRHPDAHKTNGV